MRIIISPAKKMKDDFDFHMDINTPIFVEEAGLILSRLKSLSYEEVKDVWKCNDKIAQLNYERIKKMNLYGSLVPAILSYEGIQYQYMSPGVFSIEEFDYIEEHVRILSGFYGILKPFDGVRPYRLEMQAKLQLEDSNSIYDFWKDRIAAELFSQSETIVNLASKEYSRCITDHFKKGVHIITCVFGELKDGKVVEKATKVKMARGEMVRFMAEGQVKDSDGIKGFDRLNYTFSQEFSDEGTYVFLEDLNKISKR